MSKETAKKRAIALAKELRKLKKYEASQRNKSAMYPTYAGLSEEGKRINRKYGKNAASALLLGVPAAIRADIQKALRQLQRDNIRRRRRRGGSLEEIALKMLREGDKYRGGVAKSARYQARKK